MNILKWFSSYRKPESTPSQLERDAHDGASLSAGSALGAPAPGNVIALPRTRNAGDSDLGLEAQGRAEWPPTNSSRGGAGLSGLMDEAELTEFFAENFYGFGRNHGSQHLAHEAREREIDSIVASFQNRLRRLAAKRQVRLDRISRHALELEGLGPTLIAELQLAAGHCSRDIATLNEQVQLAGDRTGWVLEALNRYRLGFDRGVRESLAFEQLFE